MTLSRKLAYHLLKHEESFPHVIDLLTRYSMLALLPSVKRDLEILKQDNDRYDTMNIESPFPISDDSLKRIKRIVGNDMATHVVSLNKNLLAGFRVQFRGMVYDGSAERIIKQFTSKD
jgi:F0F1-type ATP synthase delta subunit